MDGLVLANERANKLISAVVNSMQSHESKRKYRAALQDFIAWYEREGKPGLAKATIQNYRASLADNGMGKASINLRLSAIRKFASEMADNGLLDPVLAQGIKNIKNLKQTGIRTGNWLTLKEAQALIRKPDISTLKGLRDRAILSVFISCGLRRSEAAQLTFDHVQQREARWAIVDMTGKGGRVRTIPMPSWCKQAIDEWARAAEIIMGHVFISINKGDQIVGDSISAQALRDVVANYAKGIAPHDLRRTYAKLAYQGGAALDQIQLTLGHASIATTERYLGIDLDLTNAPGDHIRLKL